MNESDMVCSCHQVLDVVNGQQVQNHLHPEHGVCSALYAMTHYTPPSYPATNQHDLFNVHMDLSSRPKVFSVPLNHGFEDHLPSSSNHGENFCCLNENGRSNDPTEGVRELCKRKSGEAILGNIQQFSVSPGSSRSSSTPVASCHFDFGIAFEAPNPLPDYRGHGLHMAQNYNHYRQGNIGAQSFYPFDSAGLPWNGPHMLPYFQGNNMLGGSTSFLHSPPVQQHHIFLPLQNMQDVRGYGVACYPPFLGAPSRFTPNDGIEYDALSILPENTERASRPTGHRIYRSQGRSLRSDAASRRRDLPQLSNLQVDRVALLEFPTFDEVDYDVESFIDHHTHMRLDIDDMSYEDLLDLSEQIGIVNNGLSEDDILSHLKTRHFKSNAPTINLEELPCTDQNNESCTICREEYEHDDKVGSLKCGHEYHVDCLKKWLLLKNVCPVCKSCALVVGDKKK